MGGVGVGEEHEVPVEEVPMRTSEAEEVIPVERGSAGADEMNEVGAVEALAAGDEELGGNHLFGGENLAGYSEDLT